MNHVYGLTETSPFITICEPLPEHPVRGVGVSLLEPAGGAGIIGLHHQGPTPKMHRVGEMLRHVGVAALPHAGDRRVSHAQRVLVRLAAASLEIA